MVGNEETRAAKGRFLTLKITFRNGLNPTKVFVWKTIFQSWLQAKFEAGYAACSDSEFAAHLLSLEYRRK